MGQFFTRILCSRQVHLALNVYTGVGVATMLFWTIPYTFVVKQVAMRWLAKSPTIRLLVRATGGIAVILAAILWIEIRRYRRYKATWRTAKVNAATGTSSNNLTSLESANARNFGGQRRLGTDMSSSQPNSGTNSHNNSFARLPRVESYGGKINNLNAFSLTSHSKSAPGQAVNLDGVAFIPVTEAQKAVTSLSRLFKAACALMLTVFTRRAYYWIHGNIDALIDLESKKVEHEIASFKPPSTTFINVMTAPYRAYFHPVFVNLEAIPTDRPLLFISNHTIMAFDFPLLLSYLWEKKGIFLRALADHSHFQVPVNGDILRRTWGMVDGTRRNVEILMEKKQAIFCYPGGAREVFKRTTDPKYELMWKNRVGFAAMAVKYGCTIVPIINYGSEDMLDVVVDLPLGWLPIPSVWGSERTLPVMKRAGTEVQRMYFLVGKPIRTEHLKGQEEDLQVLAQVRDETKAAIELGIQTLKDHAAKDSAFKATSASRSLGSSIKSLKKSRELTGDSPIAEPGLHNQALPHDLTQPVITAKL